MSTLLNFVPESARGLSFNASKIGGVYHKPLSGRKRAELVKTLHDPTPKKWELRVPKGVKHDANKIKRLATIEKNLKTVARQMPDRVRKYPKREERTGHQWFKPTFQQKAERYFRDKSVNKTSFNADLTKPTSPFTYAELALHLLRVTGGQNVPPVDKPKLLVQLEARASGASTGQKTDGEKKKKKKK